MFGVLHLNIEKSFHFHDSNPMSSLMQQIKEKTSKEQQGHEDPGTAGSKRFRFWCPHTCFYDLIYDGQVATELSS